MADVDNEKAVLEELRKNSRASSEEIGRRLGLTRQTVSRIIKKLEKNKTIWGYTVVAAAVPNYFGILNHYIALVKLDSLTDSVNKIAEMMLDKKSREKFLEDNKLKKIRFDFTALYHGEYDIILSFSSVSLVEAKKFLSLLKKMGPEISKIDILQPILVMRRGGFLNPKLKEEMKKIL